MAKRKTHIRGSRGRRMADLLRGVDLERVLVVPIDAAKFNPKAMVANYFGDVLAYPFFFGVNREGMALLHRKIQECARRVGAQRILVGMEATGHYHEPIVAALEGYGYQVTLINPCTTAYERSSALNWAKTDDLDLATLGSILAQNKGTDSRLLGGVYSELRMAARARRGEALQCNRLKNRICRLMDGVWREFQGLLVTEPRGGARVEPVFSDMWGRAARFFMRHYPLPQQVAELGEEGIQALSRAHHLYLKRTTIAKLVEAARRAIEPDPARVKLILRELQRQLEDLDRVEERIAEWDHHLAGLLVRTPGVLLLSMPGIGVVTAAEYIGEIGPPTQYWDGRQIIKRAGTNPLVYQSGEGKVVYGPISRQGNAHLRRVLAHVGKSLGDHNPYFQAYAEALRERGLKPRQINVALGNKFAHVSLAMMKRGELFNPPAWRGQPLARSPLSRLADEGQREVALQTLRQLQQQRDGLGAKVPLPERGLGEEETVYALGL